MLIEESKWINKVIVKMNRSLSPVLLVGSGNGKFYKYEQPWIYENILVPLIKKKIKYICQDLVSGQGIDFVGDIVEPKNIRKLKKLGIKSVMIFNVLEHVEDPQKMAKAVCQIIPKGGLIFASCPYKYPLHLSPIDTLYRPNIKELAKLFSRTKIKSAKIVVDKTYFDYLKLYKWFTLLIILRLFMPFYEFPKWVSAVKHLPWLGKKFQAVTVVLEKK